MRARNALASPVSIHVDSHRAAASLAHSLSETARPTRERARGMTKDSMRYDLLAQHALRGVVREALKRVEREGLPGEHHFYITFATGVPGVRVSEILQEQYPEEMTIVLQHQFWDLKVEDERFEIGLSFNKKPEHLVVPFAAVRRFYDPSVQFGLRFDAHPDASDPEPQAPPSSDGDEAQSDEDKNDAKSGDVVSLDQFRRK